MSSTQTGRLPLDECEIVRGFDLTRKGLELVASQRGGHCLEVRGFISYHPVGLAHGGEEFVHVPAEDRLRLEHHKLAFCLDDPVHGQIHRAMPEEHLRERGRALDGTEPGGRRLVEQPAASA